MPAFVIAQGSGRTGQTANAILCDPCVNGLPDRKTDVPIRVQLVSEQTLSVDGELRRIISCIGQNGAVTYLINGTSKGLRNRERRAALARASSLLQQLAATLRPLTAVSEEPELASEELGLLFNWIFEERERLTEGASHGPR